jgi:hypothetical protein
LCRSYLVPDFRENVASLADEYEFHFLTDGQCPGTPDTRARFYDRLGKAPPVPGFSAADEADVIARCRTMRSLPRQQALDMARAMGSVIAEELDRVEPVVVLSHMVDDYVTHLTAELARRRGLQFVGYAYSYFPGKIQATLFANGAPQRLREPDTEEVATTLAEISQRTFRQNYLQKDEYTRPRHLKAMLRYQVKRVVFALRAWLEKDPLNLHYLCLPYVVERRHWRDFPAASDFHADWRERLAAQPQDRPIVYMPLGYFPEATIDYWIEDPRILNYQEEVLRICRELGREFRVVVKEHLHMLGGRSPDFYRALRDTRGVTSVPPLEFSNEVLAGADLVLMGAGSVGVEAYIRGKPIASFCARSYWFGASGATYLDLARVDTWPERIRACLRDHRPADDTQRFEFVRECLRSTMRTARAGRVWPICHPDDLRRALNLRDP